MGWEGGRLDKHWSSPQIPTQISVKLSGGPGTDISSSHFCEPTECWKPLLVVTMLEREMPRSGPSSFRLWRKCYRKIRCTFGLENKHPFSHLCLWEYSTNFFNNLGLTHGSQGRGRDVTWIRSHHLSPQIICTYPSNGRHEAEPNGLLSLVHSLSSPQLPATSLHGLGKQKRDSKFKKIKFKQMQHR